MITAIDHVVIRVNDVAQASADYEALGFTVVQGGEHADGLSHNALIAFEDGSYLELIAFKGEVPESHLFYRSDAKEGLVTYAVLPSNITADIEAARRRGLEIEGPIPGGRVRPDGQRLEWQLGIPHTHDLPFLCADVTPRELRVPVGEARRHRNGIIGIGGINVAVPHLTRSVQRYRALLGSEPSPPPEPTPPGRYALFRVGRSWVFLSEASTSSAMGDEGPSGLQLEGSSVSGIDYIQRGNSHGVGLDGTVGSTKRGK